MDFAFADTVYWQALYDIRDNLHSAAETLAADLESKRVSIVTSGMVLTEVLNALGSSVPSRRMAVDLVQKLKADPNVEVVPNADCPFDAAFELYMKRPDKEWGHTDCSSFLIMWKRGIYHVLTHDHHFTQAGFTVLL